MIHVLPVPEADLASELESQEVARCFVGQSGRYTYVAYSKALSPEAWGDLLAKLAKQVAGRLAEGGVDAGGPKVLEVKIRDAFVEEMNSGALIVGAS